MTTFNPQEYKGISYTISYNHKSSCWKAVINDKEFHAKDYGSIHKQYTRYIDSILPVEEKDEEQVRYDQEVLAQNLFNYLFLRCPEALPEVIELLDRLHNQYRGRINDD